jgi:hypothetical protein
VLCGEGEDRRVVICEVQTSKPSSRQRRRQFAYMANAGDLNGCDVYLLVLTVEVLLSLLAARGIDVPEATVALVRSCADLGQLDEWVLLAAAATAITDVFPARNEHKKVGATRRVSAA